MSGLMNLLSEIKMNMLSEIDCSKCNPKLPKLGQRYKRGNQSYTCVELKLIGGDNYYFNMLRDGADFSRQYNLEDFKFFEELHNNPKS